MSKRGRRKGNNQQEQTMPEHHEINTSTVNERYGVAETTEEVLQGVTESTKEVLQDEYPATTIKAIEHIVREMCAPLANVYAWSQYRDVISAMIEENRIVLEDILSRWPRFDINEELPGIKAEAEKLLKERSYSNIRQVAVKAIARHLYKKYFSK